MLYPRFIYQKGITHLKQAEYEKAENYLSRAEQLIPGPWASWLARSDLFTIYTNLGRTLYHQGIDDWKQNGISDSSLETLQNAKSYLEKADTIEPAHYINAYWLTRTEQGLEKSYAWLFPEKKNLYNAYPYYQKTLKLRPAGISIRQLYARYLHYKGLDDQIPELVQNMMEIYPPSYRYLPKEPFYSKDLIPCIIKGLNTAVDKKILPRSALASLSSLYASENNLEKAISVYKELLNFKPSENSPGNYIHTGALHLKTRQLEQSFEFFQKGFEKAGSPHIINSIYGRFRHEKQFLQFLRFCLKLQKKYPETTAIDMAVARCWLDMDHPELAKARLIRINSRTPHAPAYYLLSEIARKQKNWDLMERSIQKATRLDPDNAHFHYRFSQALYYQKKLAHAEEQAAKAIKYAPENPWYYNFRANIRWRQHKYPAAAQDWEKAFALKPDRSDFPYKTALAYKHLGQFKKATAFIQKALALAPDNKKYQTLHAQVK